MSDAVHTIGHSTHSIERFMALLRQYSVTALCDVRSRPYSRMNPQFNREPLKKDLRKAGIKYVFLGEELGARSEDKSCYRNGQVQYDLLAKTALFRRGIDRIKDGVRQYHVVLMCAEKEPLECHRTILVARRLFEEGVPVMHIHADGHVEEQSQAIERLITMLRVPTADMFRSHDAVVSDAYVHQAERIAYREQASSEPVSDEDSRGRVHGVGE
jgi:uncharacterized protein (DUF488 family)